MADQFVLSVHLPERMNQQNPVKKVHFYSLKEMITMQLHNEKHIKKVETIVLIRINREKIGFQTTEMVIFHLKEEKEILNQDKADLISGKIKTVAIVGMGSEISKEERIRMTAMVKTNSEDRTTTETITDITETEMNRSLLQQ